MATAPVNLGLIGLGPYWESRFRPALKKLAAKLQVVAVYDNVVSRAELAARDMHARVVGGVTAIADRAGVQAILLLDAGWQGSAVLQLLSGRGKPMLVAAPIEATSSELRQWHAEAISRGVTVMPALPRRCTPASNRLQELMATRLGRPLKAEVSISPASLLAIPFATESDFGGQPLPPQNPMLEWVDWCHYVFRASPERVARRRDETGLRLEFPPMAQGNPSNEYRVAELSLCLTAPVPERPTLDEVRLHCEHGEARLLGPTCIEWTVNASQHAEELTAERTETEVLLDHFCRRVVGGLIPVPTLEDLSSAKISADAR